jgi:hypothetical protein
MAELGFTEKACDLAMCKCNAAAPGCSTPQHCGVRLEDVGKNVVMQIATIARDASS